MLARADQRRVLQEEGGLSSGGSEVRKRLDPGMRRQLCAFLVAFVLLVVDCRGAREVALCECGTNESKLQGSERGSSGSAALGRELAVADAGRAGNVGRGALLCKLSAG